jgi:hypothetical protein
MSWVLVEVIAPQNAHAWRVGKEGKGGDNKREDLIVVREKEKAGEQIPVLMAVLVVLKGTAVRVPRRV